MRALLTRYFAAGDDSVSSVPNVLPGLPSENIRHREASGSEAALKPEADYRKPKQNRKQKLERACTCAGWGRYYSCFTEEQSRVDAEILAAFLVDIFPQTIL